MHVAFWILFVVVMAGLWGDKSAGSDRIFFIAIFAGVLLGIYGFFLDKVYGKAFWAMLGGFGGAIAGAILSASGIFGIETVAAWVIGVPVAIVFALFVLSQ